MNFTTLPDTVAVAFLVVTALGCSKVLWLWTSSRPSTSASADAEQRIKRTPFFPERRTRRLAQRCVAGKPVREMAKVCALSAPGFLLGVFLGFGGLFFRLLCVVVLGGRPKGGEATAARDVARRCDSERAEFFEGLVD